MPMEYPFIWVQPGQWAFNRRRDEYVLVLQKATHESDLSVQVRVWRSDGKPVWYEIDYFYENWEPCEEPPEPLTAWERLLGAGAFDDIP